MIFLLHFKRLPIRKFCFYLHSLIGRNILTTEDLAVDEVKSLLWTALDLQHLVENLAVTLNNQNTITATLLVNSPNFLIQTSMNDAAKILNAHLHVYVDSAWHTQKHTEDLGKHLSISSDIILCQTNTHSKIVDLAKGSCVPVVCIKSYKFAPLLVLTYLLSLQKHYGYLEGLKMVFIGEPCPLLNTLLCWVPQLLINVNYSCTCNSKVGISPANLPTANNYSAVKDTHLNEYHSPLAAMKDAQAIICNVRCGPHLKVKMQDIDKAASRDWCILHPLPRGNEVETEVAEHTNSLMGQIMGDLKWVHAALMMRLLRNVPHVTTCPKF